MIGVLSRASITGCRTIGHRAVVLNESEQSSFPEVLLYTLSMLIAVHVFHMYKTTQVFCPDWAQVSFSASRKGRMGPWK